jgi:hypothetical protein
MLKGVHEENIKRKKISKKFKQVLKLQVNIMSQHIEHSPSQEANRSVASQETPHISWDPKSIITASKRACTCQHERK